MVTRKQVEELEKAKRQKEIDAEASQVITEEGRKRMADYEAQIDALLLLGVRSCYFSTYYSPGQLYLREPEWRELVERYRQGWAVAVDAKEPSEIWLYFA